MTATLPLGDGKMLVDLETNQPFPTLSFAVCRSVTSPAELLGLGLASEIIPSVERWLANESSIEFAGEIEGVAVGNLFTFEGHTSVYASIDGSRQLFVQNKNLEIVLCVELTPASADEWQSEFRSLRNELDGAM